MDNKKRNSIREFFVFNLIGVITTLIGLALYFFLIYIGFNYIFALFIDYVFGIAFSFIMNKTYTFPLGASSSCIMFRRLICVYGVMFFLNIILLTCSVELFHMSKFIGQIVSCGLLAFLTFFLQKFIVFR